MEAAAASSPRRWVIWASGQSPGALLPCCPATLLSAWTELTSITKKAFSSPSLCLLPSLVRLAFFPSVHYSLPPLLATKKQKKQKIPLLATTTVLVHTTTHNTASERPVGTEVALGSIVTPLPPHKGCTGDHSVLQRSVLRSLIAGLAATKWFFFQNGNRFEQRTSSRHFG
jgi:hypothetical protein